MGTTARHRRPGEGKPAERQKSCPEDTDVPNKAPSNTLGLLVLATAMCMLAWWNLGSVKTLPQDRVIELEHRKIVVVPNFLPTKLAEQWRDRMKRDWAQSKPLSAGLEPQENASWLYTSNTEGGEQSGDNLNQKVRGNVNIHERKEKAKLASSMGKFAYSKWELPPDHDLVEEIKAYMESEIPKHKVAKYFNVSTKRISQELSDMFVTNYAAGDFLNTHDDSFAGRYAFVVSLTDGPEYDPKFGGQLDFFCERARTWCQQLSPKFNTAVFFLTQVPSGPLHRVLAVNDAASTANWNRFGFTGWYIDTKYGMSDIATRERDKMKGKNLK